MAPVEFEKHIKERFESRKIEPSQGSWKKVADQLESPAPPKRTSFFTYGIAAAAVGVLLALSWVLNSGVEVVPEDNSVVENPGVEELNQNTETQPEASPIIIADTYQEAEEEMQQAEINTVVVQSEIVAPKAEERTTLEPVSIEQNLIIDNKITDIVAQVTLLESESSTVTDAEVESLLKNAQREILSDKNFREGREVDANSLLAGVEDELDQSFRDQVFDKLKQGFIKVRTAVADRNK